jgi:hypothetical protein
MGKEKRKKKTRKERMKWKKRKEKNQGNPDNAAKSYARILLPSVPLKKAPGIYLTVS